MIIHGLQKTTLLDFPGRVACTVFFGGCNMRCPFCHNSTLVLDPGSSPSISEDEFFGFLEKRKNILDGVCITGGEPLMQKDIVEFIKKIKSRGFMVKLDTNGTYPSVLRELVESKLVDYVAMDIKNSKEKYSATCGVVVKIDDIDESIGILRSSDIDFEFRTTVVRELHTADDLERISMWLVGAPKYFLQSFVDSGDIMSDGLSAYSPQEMSRLLEVVKGYIPTASLRGI